MARWEVEMKDTLYTMYQGNKWYFRDTTTLWPYEIAFSCDSIRGRGDKREVLMTSYVKDMLPRNWVWVKSKTWAECWADTIASGMIREGNGGIAFTKWRDTISYLTPDSTSRESKWLAYTRKDPCSSMILTDASGSPDELQMLMYPNHPEFFTRRWLKWYVEKVVGDPTKNNGKDQLVLVRFRYYSDQDTTITNRIEGRIN